MTVKRHIWFGVKKTSDICAELKPRNQILARALVGSKGQDVGS